MKTLLSTTAVALALGLLAMPSKADVFVVATITKDQTVLVTDSLTKNKTASITVTFDAPELAGAAEANAVANIDNHGNVVTAADLAHAINPGIFGGVAPSTTEMQVFRFATISGSISTNNGIVGVNQDVGNMSNQANIVAFAMTDVGDAFVNSQADLSQNNSGNSVWHVEPPFEGVAPPTNLSAVIDTSINGNIGVVGVNQNAGNMNNQTNELALAVGTSAVYALAEADLGQNNSGNIVQELNTGKVGSISGSINGNTGIVQVNQSTGNMNNQASAFSISVLTSSVSITP